MKVADLGDYLRSKAIPAEAWALDDPLADEAYVLQTGASGWIVYYAEQGLRSNERRFDAEDKAVDALLAHLRGAFPDAGA